MAEERVQRRLAAIMAADVVGYSRLMGADEEGTLARLSEYDRRRKAEQEKTARLRALRLAKEAADREAAATVGVRDRLS